MNPVEGIYKQTRKMIIFTVVMIALCRFTKGYFGIVMVAMGIGCAAANKFGWSLVYFVIMPFFVIMNPGILPKSSAFAYALRFGPLLIGLVLAFQGMSRKGRHRLPFIYMMPFLVAALLSVLDSWAPQISLMKWVNFVVFLFGIWYGTQNLQYRVADVFILRSFFLSLACVLVFGSVALLPFPGISYATSLSSALAEGGMEYAQEVFKNIQADEMTTLFCGITNHSQAFAPVLVCTFGWVVCDMLFVERRFRWLHLALILVSFPLLYMTRSRVALVSTAFTLVIINFYVVRRVELPQKVRNKLRQGLLLGGILIGIGVVVMQVQGGKMSQWIRKTNDVEYDKRSLVDALTGSRMGLIDQSMREFRRNPLIGSGFQVAEYTRDLMKAMRGKLVISASIEKGILPVMVLGETGILGASTFLIFLVMFYMTCARRQYYVTITMFSILIATNMGEATFFSPGGGGGILWIVSTVGGFTLDTVILHRSTLEHDLAELDFWERQRAAEAESGREPPDDF